MLYNLAVLKYARDATPGRRADIPLQPHQLQAARLSYIAAAVQGRWIETPPPPRVRVQSTVRQWRASLTRQMAGLSRPAVILLVTLLAIAALVLGYGAYRARRAARLARAESLNSQGVAYMQQGDLEVAEDLFEQAIELDARYATAYHNLGMAYYVQGDLSQAAQQFRSAIDLDPAYASPHYALGRVYDERGQANEALDELRQAIALDAGMSEAYNEIGLILNRQGHYAQAASILNEGLEKGRDKAPPYLLKNLGRSYLGLDNPARAIEHLEAAAAYLSAGDTLYIDTHRLLAQAYEAQGALDKARQEWNGPLQHEPDAQENLRRLSPTGSAAL
jgi:Tfp pilus assembly protein PilF